MLYPKFEDIQVSTKTFIINTNLLIDIPQLYNNLPITKYIVIPKKRGRKKKVTIEDPNKDIKNGSIITIKYGQELRGVEIKENKNKNYFRNSVTIVIVIDGKLINFKLSRNGKFQMTGCKKDEHGEQCIKYIWDYIKENKNIYKIIDIEHNIKNDLDTSKIIDKSDTDNLQAIFVPAMRNIDFSIDFKVDRAELDKYINTMTDYNSLLETSIGYTGVNIKFPNYENINDLVINKMEFSNNSWIKSKYNYSDYIKMLNKKDYDKKINKKRYNTFLVFQSGKIIMSGTTAEWMKQPYEEFIQIIKESKHIIEEKLD
jgi:TATA-box binding protein (TBP) (component of TFIID and TFIIIB)